MRLRHLIAGSVPLLVSAWIAREVVAEGSPVLRPDADPEAPDPETVTRPRPH